MPLFHLEYLALIPGCHSYSQLPAIADPGGQQVNGSKEWVSATPEGGPGRVKDALLKSGSIQAIVGI